ncbi:ankyrin repeat domain-containing protein [Streptomyces antimicrobicus]|uniref:Ankyrin repeat domain-containing protein n=1 Tax=Streptomyces antimicrobicus TaxID=2883108 RepID=A0ABS8BCF8_9ACTN|nr:ankyrin repeat domain-containing protein [Streptomyces antimicrobicus]MCB5182214.1 ankyrin repeat domain-containing protein [Streptomyces antimicrobicus]
MTSSSPSLPGGIAPGDAPVWQRIRRYAVPRWMIEQATAHRLAGDWRAACAAAAVDPLLDLDDLRARHGDATAEAVTDDLRHLAPDLMRWHLPRRLGGRTTLATDRRILLARYPGAPATSQALTLIVTTTPMMEGPQRLRLTCVPLGGRAARNAEDWTQARHLWDARHAATLRERCTGGADRLPFFHADGTPLTTAELPSQDPGPGDPAARSEWIAVLHHRGETAEALRLTGIVFDPEQPQWLPSDFRAGPAAALARLPLDLGRPAAECRRLAAAGVNDRFRADWVWPLVLEPTGPAPEDPVRARFADRDEAGSATRLPEYTWQPQPDLHLLRTGRLTVDDLHPLVAAALFPQAPPAAGPPGPAEPAPVRVRCRDGAWHEVRFRGGDLVVPHTAQEIQREQALRAFGGAVAGCFAVREYARSGQGRLPRALHEQRRELMLRAQHGDTPGVVALLDAGVDPRLVLPGRRTLLHVLHLLDHRELLPRLLAAGLDLEAVDHGDRTPLMTAVTYGGSAELVRDLLAAGARLDALDDMELSLSQVIRRYRRDDLAFLAERVDEEFPGVGAEWFDEWMEERAEYAQYDGQEDEDE